MEIGVILRDSALSLSVTDIDELSFFKGGMPMFSDLQLLP